MQPNSRTVPPKQGEEWEGQRPRSLSVAMTHPEPSIHPQPSKSSKRFLSRFLTQSAGPNIRPIHPSRKESITTLSSVNSNMSQEKGSTQTMTLLSSSPTPNPSISQNTAYSKSSSVSQTTTYSKSSSSSVSSSSIQHMQSVYTMALLPLSSAYGWNPSKSPPLTTTTTTTTTTHNHPSTTTNTTTTTNITTTTNNTNASTSQTATTTPNDTIKKSSQKTHLKGFGKLFKKFGITSEEAVFDNLPHVRPVQSTEKSSHSTNYLRTIPLAPAPSKDVETSSSHTPYTLYTPSTPSTPTTPHTDVVISPFPTKPTKIIIRPKSPRPRPEPKNEARHESRPPRTKRHLRSLPPLPLHGNNLSHHSRHRPVSMNAADTSKRRSTTLNAAHYEGQEVRLTRNQSLYALKCPSSSSWSNPSTEKASEPYSFYSTFAVSPTDSLDGKNTTLVEEEASYRRPSSTPSTSLGEDLSCTNDPYHQDTNTLIETSSMDSFNTVDSSVGSDSYSLREPTGMDSISEEPSILDTNSVTSTDTEVFLSARDDLEPSNERCKSKLTKRLSGGHYGSAGGIMISTAPVPPLPTHMKRRSQPPPEDIAHAMLEWKRRNDGNSKRSSDATAHGRSSLEEQEISRLSDTETGLAEAAAAAVDIADTADTADTLTPLDTITIEQVTSPTTLTPTTTLATTTTTTHERIRQPRNRGTTLSTFFSKSMDATWLETSPDLVAVRDPRLSTTSTPEIPMDRVEESEPTKDPREAAKALWTEDETFVPRDRIAEWLGQRESFRTSTLAYYMEYFNFTGMRLDVAFRKLCGKLYLKAEAQQMDRILEVFAKRYWRCNTHSMFRNSDVVYAIVYSLLLLNTDLHVAQGNYHRMTRSEFVRNTMAAIGDQKASLPEKNPEFVRAWEADVEAHLKELYASVKQYQILQPLSKRSHGSSVQLERQSSVLSGRHGMGLKRGVHSIMRKGTKEAMSEDALSLSPSTKTNAVRASRRSSISSATSATSYGSHDRPISSPYQTISTCMSQNSLLNQQTLYLKEGIVIRKHLLENAQQRAKHRDWKECFLVVEQGEIKMYGLNGTGEGDRRSMFRPSSTHFGSESNTSQMSLTSTNTSTYGQRWTTHTQLLGTLTLNHTLSNILPPPGYNRLRPHVFALQQPEGGVYLFQANSASQTMEWIATSNYWAARKSKEPLPGGVSNMEYGWGACLNDADVTILHEWKPPLPPMVSSTLEEKDQYDALQRYLSVLNTDINDHRELKPLLLDKFPSKHSLHMRALSNWESKSKYLLHEIIKYQNYCDALEKSFQFNDTEDLIVPSNTNTNASTSASASASASTVTCAGAGAHSPSSTHTITEKDAASPLVFQASTLDLMKEIGDELQLAF
ncbi:hypothetical protein BDF14DRAFT_1843492 [Spinellus fusiger]|nr:hypothetical protein BDF14DRAFT_1843492 [Spinellus fusiger]